MTKEDAIAIIRKEYLCVDRDCDIERSCGKCDLVMPDKEPILEAYKMAIEALQQEPKTDTWSIKDVADTLAKHGLIAEHVPCDDCISRQAVIELCEGWWLGHTKEDDFATEVRALPSVNPQKIGHWTHDESLWKNRFICSECGYKLFDEQTNYCPN